VGAGGDVLEAVQHLAQRIVLRGAGGLRVVVDAAGYRSRREEALRREADRVADRAVSEGRDIAMRPMPATERRFVHEYLRERGDVATHSEGDEPRRRLVVSPDL
jgi:spoIIIJ-associated protein